MKSGCPCPLTLPACSIETSVVEPEFSDKVQEIGNGEFKLDVDPQLQCGFGRVHASGETIMRQGKAGVLQGDPYYSPNLSRERADFSLSK